jgi:surface antigen
MLAYLGQWGMIAHCSKSRKAPSAMNTHSTLSSYLVRPRLTNHRRQRLISWKIRLRLITQAHPKLVSNLVLIIAAWAGLSFSYNYLLSSRNLIGQSAYAGVTTGASSSSVAVGYNPLKLPTETRKTALPGGPSGQLLPPGAMAPDKTYANSYSRGQCTWYVAGRRPVPRNWGHARSWYYHAVASGYRVGTTPAVAAIAWTSSGYYGHVALVEAVSSDHKRVLVSEMNYRGPYIKSTRWVSASSFRYIY